MKIPRIRYAALVAALGLLSTLVPDLAVQAQEWLRTGSLLVAAVMAAAKLLAETLRQVDSEDPMVIHLDRTPLPRFWRRVL